MASMKRKASELIDGSSVGDERIDNEKQQQTNLFLDLNDSPESIADAILRAGRDNNNEAINSLLQAAHLAEACINEKKRRRLRKEAAQSIGSWPDEVHLKVLEYVSKPELVHNTSLVCKRWRDASRSPLLWSTLDDAETGTLRFDKEISSLDDINDLLDRPQFSLLKKFQPPRSTFLIQNSFQTISRLCPHIEEINIWNVHLHPSTLMEFPDIFPKLSKFDVSLRDRRGIQQEVTGKSLVDFCEKMGDRLRQLRVCDEQSVLISTLGNERLLKISKFCPNLECLHLHSRYTGERRLGISVMGVKNILQNCPRLKILELVKITTNTSIDFSYIIENAKNLRRLLLVGYASIASLRSTEIRRAFRDKEEYIRFKDILLQIRAAATGAGNTETVRRLVYANAGLLRQCGFLTRVDHDCLHRACATHNQELDIELISAKSHDERMDACRTDRSQTYLGQKWCYD